MNDLSALLAHMGRCCPNDDAARRPRAGAAAKSPPPREDAAELSPPAGPMLRPPTASVAGQRLDVLRLRPLGPELSRALGLDAMIGSARRARTP
ncbi:hypothetical protein JL721_10891 [Aureococcus anophagefferens]|nr:hypothetical protein JL721_10891 [Aureococcus anophagefferens]